MSDMTEKYRKAERLLPWNVKEAVLNGRPSVKKFDEDAFFYPYQTRKDGHVQTTFRKVNVSDGSEEDLFDHAALCELLGTDEIPFDSCDVAEDEILFSYEDYSYAYIPSENRLEKREYIQKRAVSVSPDEKKELFVRDYDLWLRDRETGCETRLTNDGEKDFAYGKEAEFSGYISARLKGEPEIPEVLWSPDSEKFLTYKLDQRNVGELYLIQSYDEEGRDSIRPRLHTYKCAFPEDEAVPYARYYIGDVLEKKMVRVDMDPEMTGGSILGPEFSKAKWLVDSSAVYTTHVTRANLEASFVIIYPDGSTKTVITEDCDTALNICTYGELDGYGSYCASNLLSEDRKTVVWQSERDNYARLFCYDAENGQLKNAMTSADYSVGQLIYHDEEFVYFYANNLSCTSDPYYELACRVRYDGSDFRILTPEDAMHSVTFVSGVLVDTYSRVDLPPVTNIRKPDGALIRELVRADISDLLERGYIIPERFSVTASDGKTELYGILIRPADFDETKSYPFVDYIYGGMQCYNVPKAFAYDASIEGREIMGGLEELAQLGFAGIILDGLGTPGRGKKLHDISYENIHGCAGLKDHVYVLPQLKEKYPFLDLERAGIWGNSGGGCATSRAMLEYPDTYKVGVSSAGNHDQRMYNSHWTERYYGPYQKDIYIKGDNTSLAENLKGKLYIVHGAMDDNVAMSQSIRLVDALIRADKDFDFMILPRTNHNVPANPYFIRRKLDYFVRYLLHEEVPAYRFQGPEEE